MSPRLRKLLVGILALGLLTGCWDRKEIEERTSVFAMAVDNHPAGVQVSVQIPVPIMIIGAGGGGGGEGGQGAVHNFTAVGNTVSEALENLENQANQDLFLGHTRLLLLSEELVREKGMQVLDAFRRHPEIRRRLWPLIVKGRAQEALGLDVRLSEIPTEYILDFVENGSSEGRMAETSLGKWFINQSDPTRSAYINYLQIQPAKQAGGSGKSGGQGEGSGGKVVWKGIAVMRGNRMVGSLSREDSSPVLEVVEKKPGYHTRILCPDRKGRIVFEPKSIDPSLSLSHSGKRVNIRVNVKVVGGIVESTCSELDLSKGGVLDQVDKWFARAYEKQARKTLRRLQKEFRTDAFQFGSYIHAYHPDLWKQIDWEQEFPKAHITFNYQVTIKNLGLEAY